MIKPSILWNFKYVYECSRLLPSVSLECFAFLDFFCINLFDWLVSFVSFTESLAAKQKDTGGVCFVSAFQGLFAPYWNAEARGYVCLCVYLSVMYRW